MSASALGRSRQEPMSRGQVLVIGGAGYVGAHAAKALAQSGYRPVLFDRQSAGASSARQFGPIEHGDLHDREKLSSILRHYQPVAIVHAANSKFCVADRADPLAYYDMILRGTLTLLEEMRACSISNLCLITSAAIYGRHAALGIAEQTPTEPLTPYAAALTAIENMTADFGAANGLNWISLRLFCVGGADHQSGLGEQHEYEDALIPVAIDAALGHRSHVPILGSHFATRDGTALRDFVHVSDVANAVALAVEHLMKRDAIGPYNIGTGRDWTVLEIIRKVEEIMGKKCPVRYESKRADEPYALSASFERAQDELGWTPTQSKIENIISSAVAFRQLYWAERAKAAEEAISPQSNDLFIHHEAITELSVSPGQDDILLQKLDAFLKR